MIKNLKKYFLSGLMVFLPIALTIFLFYFAIVKIDGWMSQFFQPYFMKRFGFYFHGLGILLGVYIIILIGFFTTNFIGRRVHRFFEQILLKLPFVRQVYPALKEMAVFLFSQDQLKSFKQVVLVEYPRKGIYSFGFLTKGSSSPKLCQATGKDLCHVFISSSPSPLTGFVILVPKEDVIFTDLTIEETFKFIVSGGVVCAGEGNSEIKPVS